MFARSPRSTPTVERWRAIAVMFASSADRRMLRRRRAAACLHDRARGRRVRPDDQPRGSVPCPPPGSTVAHPSRPATPTEPFGHHPTQSCVRAPPTSMSNPPQRKRGTACPPAALDRRMAAGSLKRVVGKHSAAPVRNGRQSREKARNWQRRRRRRAPLPRGSHGPRTPSIPSQFFPSDRSSSAGAENRRARGGAPAPPHRAR